MAVGLVGKKIGMTRLFEQDGHAIPATVVAVERHRVAQIKALEKEGYQAIQVTYSSVRPGRLTRPVAGHYEKAGIAAGCGLYEFRVTDSSQWKIGDEYGLERFSVGQPVDVSATSIGKGFAGVIKRHHFSRQGSSHGNSVSHRAPGSIGQNQSPGRVFKNKKMAGHLGNKRRTTQNLTVLRIDEQRQLLLIKGSVAGHPGARVLIRPAVKRPMPEQEGS